MNPLELAGIEKRFPGVVALDGVDLDVRAGEIHALVGQNGAGKSTLAKILTGLERADAGTFSVDGRRVRPRSPAEALALGIGAIHQEVDLVPELSLAENLLLGREPLRWWGSDRRELASRARRALADLGVEVDVRRAAKDVPLGVQQQVCIARALSSDARILIYDEPTASLGSAEVERLFAQMRALRERGLAQVFVAHSLEQVFALADRITVLRDGKRVGTFVARESSPHAIVEAMLGAALGGAPERRASTAGHAWFEARGLARPGVLAPIDFALAPGEVLGVVGLVGSGRTELARALVAADPGVHGERLVDGAPVRVTSPRAAARVGLWLSPEDRKVDGLCLGLSVRENLALGVQRRARFARVSRAEQTELAERWIRALGIAATPEQRVGTLSGGNQQKVILARLLAAEPRLVVLDEPTRGVDVGAKAQLEARIAECAERGLSVLFISSELDEVVRRARRVLVLRDRRAEVLLVDADVAALRRAMAGGETAGTAPHTMVPPGGRDAE
ncbi:MAG: sugar ABC transporter ATP-binding protein [Planctomycetes bacterium]|nr:sugar ABC transporter ATP-binding protein [Planctomycetota bacterium]